MQESHITLAHGNGGRHMRELIETMFSQHLGNDHLDIHADAVALPLPRGELVVTTDGFTVQPLEFPGGDIGSLAVHGTINDLAVAGAFPLYLTLNVFIEEGLEMALLEKIIASLGHAARKASVAVTAGDTKVLPQGECSGLYLATTGIGVRQPTTRLGLGRIRVGDRILVSGPIGDHGIAIMLAREQFGLRGELRSDVGSVRPLTEALLSLGGVHFMRDPTRGGLATVMHEMTHNTGLGILIHEDQIPIRDPVRSACDILGYDPLFLACEGRVVAAVSPEIAEAALALWQSIPSGELAALIGTMTKPAGSARVILRTPLGGERIIDELEDDPLPRIC